MGSGRHGGLGCADLSRGLVDLVEDLLHQRYDQPSLFCVNRVNEVSVNHFVGKLTNSVRGVGDDGTDESFILELVDLRSRDCTWPSRRSHSRLYPSSPIAPTHNQQSRTEGP